MILAELLNFGVPDAISERGAMLFNLGGQNLTIVVVSLCPLLALD